MKKIDKQTEAELKRLYKLHCRHPEFNQKDLNIATELGTGAVNLYWSLFVIRKIAEIRDWDEVFQNE